jgi:hypothetical protein
MNYITFECELNALGAGAIKEVLVPEEDISESHRLYLVRLGIAAGPLVMGELDGRTCRDGILRKEGHIHADDLNSDLRMIFCWGNRESPMLQEGDVIRYNGQRYYIDFIGFKKLNEGDVTIGRIIKQ